MANKEVPWYHWSFGELEPSMYDLLINYGHVPAEKIKEKIIDIREKGWQIYPYPCVGSFHFLKLNLSTSPNYSNLLSRLQSGQALLDLGCCFAQDIRKLVHDGAPSEKIYGADLYPRFMDLGYELFQDHDRLKSTFLQVDATDPEFPQSTPSLDGKMDIVHLGLFLHHFDWEQCIIVCKRIVRCLKAETGTMVIGSQVGCLKSDGKSIVVPSGGILYRHDIESFEGIWKVISSDTDTEWKADIRLEKTNGFGEKWQIEGTRRLSFEVQRIR